MRIDLPQRRSFSARRRAFWFQPQAVLLCRRVCSHPSRTVALTGLFLLLSSSAALRAQRELSDIPAPDPVAELAAMRLTAGAAANLYASEPEIRKPIQINFDSRGRLWVASSEVYPQIEPGQVANDKIIVLEDRDGDGIAEKSTVFADGLLIPTGVVPDENGGAYVAASTELLHFADTDGDGVADQRRVVFSGFGTEDTHHLIHTLRWGPDGCLYFNQSIYIHSHIETAYGTRHLDGGGIWRYRPDSGELSVFCKGFINPWGHSFDAWGESFVTDGAGSEGIHHVFPDSVFVTSPGAMRWLPGLNPGSPKHCGLEIVSGTHFPPAWSGNLITSDFRGQRVCRFTVAAAGTSYTSNQLPEVLTSGHIAFRPVDARMGPDGALYVADWYNPIIQHGEVDFRDPRRDREHGRIWRVHFPDRPLDRLPDFSSATTEQLIHWLQSPALHVRQFARQHLWPRVRQRPDEVLQAVARWRDAAPDAPARAARALEQQWLGEVAGQLAEDAFQIIAATPPPHPASRPSLRSAVRVAGPTHPAVAPRLRAAALGEDPATRLEAVVALGWVGEGQLGEGQLGDPQAAVAAAETLIAVAQRSDRVAEDRVLDFALWQSLRKLSGAWVEALRAGSLPWQPHADGLAYAVSAVASQEAAQAVLPLLGSGELSAEQQRVIVAAIAAAGDPAALAQLLQRALAADVSLEPGGLGLSILERLVQRTARDRTVPRDGPRLLAERFSKADHLPDNPAAANTVIAAAGLWKSEAMLPLLLQLADPAAGDAPASDAAAAQALTATLRALAQFSSPETTDMLLRWARQGHQRGRADAAIAATVALASGQPQRSAAAAVRLLRELDQEGDAQRLLVTLRPNQAVAKAIASELAQSQLPAERARGLLAAVTSSGGDTALEEALRVAGGLDKSGWEPTPELIAELLHLARESGDPVRGEAVYRRASLQCITCHAIGDAGGLVGPNLMSLGSSSQPDYILESLWLPDAKIKEGYNTLAVLTDDGRVTAGIPLGRSDTTLRLRLADGQEVELAVETIEAEQPGPSLMPGGLVDTLTKTELADLVAFLAALGRQEGFTVTTQQRVRNFETLTFSPAAHRRLGRTSIDAVAGEDAAFTWRAITARVNATLPLEELDTFQRGSLRLAFVRFELTVADAVSVQLPTQGGEFWIDGKPTPPADALQQLQSPGTYRVVVAIDRQRFSGDFRVDLVADR